jgi:hypothetical protein
MRAKHIIKIWNLAILFCAILWLQEAVAQNSKAGAQQETNVASSRIPLLIGLTNADQIVTAYDKKQINNAEATWALSNRLARLNLTNLPELRKAYDKNLITKEEAMWQQMQWNNLTRQDFYGKVIDQYGQPVVGADVAGHIALEQGWDSDEKYQHYKTQTDANGLFQFTGLRGASLGEKISKAGYEIGGRKPYQGPVGEKTSPTDRGVYTMWKLRGSEPMVQKEFALKNLPYDGTPATFDLATGKKAPNGDLQITLSRSPLQLHRGWDKHDWTAKIEMLKGGLLPENDPYPNWAPEGGYQSSFETNMSSNSVPWIANPAQSFYIKSSHGQYGRMFLKLYTDSLGSNTVATVKLWINPSGSRNLEFDPSKQIQ